MWPFEQMFERRGEQEYLRIGAHAMERWTGPSAKLSLRDRHPMPDAIGDPLQGLEPAIRALYPTPSPARVTVLLESVRLPVMHLEVGTALWRSAQIQPLLLHRLRQQYDDRRVAASDWSLRLDYRAGENFALGYGLPQQLQSAVVEAGEAVGMHWAAILPALAWGLQHRRPGQHLPNGNGWWVWPEQDRLLIAKIESRKLVALNAGVPLTEDSEQINRLVAAEAFRMGCGVNEDPISAMTWSPVELAMPSKSRLNWLPIAGASPVPAPAGQDMLSPSGYATP